MTKRYKVVTIDTSWPDYVEALDQYIGQVLEEKEDSSHSCDGGVCLWVDDGDDFWWFERVGLVDVDAEEQAALDFANTHEVVPKAPMNKYMREIAPGVFVDVYDVLYAFNVTDPCLQHLIKKALATGVRGHKSEREDLVDIVDSAKRAVEHYDRFN